MFSRAFYLRQTVPLKGYLSTEEAVRELTECEEGMIQRAIISELVSRGLLREQRKAALLFAVSERGGERAAILYSLIGTCRMNSVEPREWQRYDIGYIQDWPANRVRDLLLWKVNLTAE